MSADLREISLMLYMDVMEKNKFLHIEMNRVLDKYDYLEKQEKAFIKKLVTGSVERCISIDAVINSFSKLRINKMKPFIRSLLRMSAYQILYMENVADAVAVDEAVKLCKQHSFKALSGFVNAILRNISRNKNKLQLTTAQELEIGDEIYSLLKAQYKDKADRICQSYLNHDAKGVVIRVNRSKAADEEKLISGLNATEISKELGCYRIISSGNLSYSDEFNNGEFIVQDTAACLPVYFSGAKAGCSVLELCAAPGGKTIQLLDIMKDSGRVVSRDISEARCEMIDEALHRCGFNSCEVQAADARMLAKGDKNSFDICLVDAPCSGLGVIGSKPDIRFNFNSNGLKDLVNIQREILASAVWSVKPGGYLIYSTCTLNREENECAIEYALGLRKSHAVNIESKLPKCFTEYENNNECLTIFPTLGVCEGFFVGMIQMDE